MTGTKERKKGICILKVLRTLDIGDEGVKGTIEEFMTKSECIGVQLVTMH